MVGIYRWHKGSAMLEAFAYFEVIMDHKFDLYIINKRND